MNEKWTPGPWMVEEQNCHAGQVATCHGDADTYYEVWSMNWGNGIDQNANANLIAAAPEMYEALKLALHLVEMSGSYRRVDIAEKCKAALKKARGED